MNATAEMSAVMKIELRCPDCQVKQEFPHNFTADDLPFCCDICAFHRNHELTHDALCPVCVARLWRIRLRAFLILLRNAPALRLDAE